MLLPALYAATLFAGAALLFLVQPLVGKLLLPLVGGTPGVWNTCLVFFQAVLLGGYLYAHATATRLGTRRQAAAHLVVLALVPAAIAAAAAATGDPVPVVGSLVPEDEDYPVLGVVALLAVAVGVPFFVLSTTAPVLQRWFAATGHPAGRDPYFLYAASNAGSLLGLLAYPFLIEPRLTLAEQQWAWAAGLGVYLALVLVCAFTVMRSAEFGLRKETRDLGPVVPQTAPVTPRPEFRTPHSPFRFLRWVALAALPSSLLLGVTAHISTNLAPVPLLWVVPLALYLVSFVLAFGRWPDRAHRFVGRVTPMLVLFAVLTLLTGAADPLAAVVGVHLLAFFGVCLVCHGELARDRPPADQLTRFYLAVSAGGVLGGAVNALAAPLIFSRLGIVEYPLALALAGLVRPGAERLRLRAIDVILVLGLFGLALGLVLAVPRFVTLPADPDDPSALTARLARGGLMYGLPAVVAFALVRNPARYALALGVLLAAGVFDPGPLGPTLHRERNFFGVLRVTRSADGTFVRLVHGTTLHGQQRLDESSPPRPMTYYHQKGPVGRVFDALPAGQPRAVAAVGLGVGSVAAYARPGQRWVFYEIDPAVVRIAQNPDYFAFLAHCRADWEVITGDARRQLARAVDGAFDLIILDAFSSDAIPVHLLTREALRLYLAKLAPGGVLAAHVSNNHLDLVPLVARLAADHDPPLACRASDDFVTEAERADGKTESRWVVLARSEADLGKMTGGPHWRPVRIERPVPVWRDDFANILSVWKRDEE